MVLEVPTHIACLSIVKEHFADKKSAREKHSITLHSHVNSYFVFRSNHRAILTGRAIIEPLQTKSNDFEK